MSAPAGKTGQPFHWAVVTAVLYVLTLLALTVPVLALAFKDGAALDVFTEPNYWIGLGVLFLLQGVALFFPVAVARAQPRPRKSWITLLLATGLLFALL